MKKAYLLALAVVILISSCHKPSNQGNIVLKFNPMFGPNNLMLNTQYQSPDGRYYNFEDFKFFISHIKLIHSDNSSVEVSAVQYISLDDSYTLSIPMSCPQGTYTGIQFYIGLDSVQDAVSPDATDTGSPVFVNHYMTWGISSLEYVFVQIDGLAGGNANPTSPMEYHVGTSPYYTASPVLAKSFSVSGGGQTVITLTAQVQNIFYNSPGAINVLTNPVTQTTDNPALAHTFISDFSQIFSLQ
jgi:hypothetical protein